MIIYLINYIPPKIYSLNDTEFELTIKEYKIDGNKLSIEFNEYLVGNYYFKTKEEKEKFILEINDKVKIIGKLYKPTNNSVPNTFNYKEYLYHKGISYILNIEEIYIKQSNKNLLYKLKNYIYNRINQLENNEYLYAFILGKTYNIDNGVYETYKVNGITHLFSLSASHVSVFSAILFLLLDKLKINKKLSLFIVSVFLIFFSFVSSFSPSLLRATIFFILNNLNKLYNMKISNIKILCLTFVILILINPNYIYNIGFILSFTITLFLLIFSKTYQIKNKLINAILVSVIAYLSSLPIIINMNYEINIIGFINNLFFIPYVSYIVFPISLISFFIPYLSVILNLSIKIMEYISSISANLINITLYFQKLNYVEISIYYVILILLLKYPKTIILNFIFLIIYIYTKPMFSNNTNIYFIDVSQGDSALIVTKNNISILIDTGGKVTYEKEEWEIRNNEYNFPKSTLIPFFKSIGLKSIDYMLLTHGDTDHLGYAKDIKEYFNVENIYINKGEINELESNLSHNILMSEYIKIDNVEIYSLNNKIYDNENDNSLVFLIKIDDIKILFTGDASIKVEKDILKKYNLENIDILKVGHHGSNTSTSEELIQETKPIYSIISVGKNNMYNHPHESVLKTISNTKIYRTDQKGTIKFTIDKNLKIQTFSP